MTTVELTFHIEEKYTDAVNAFVTEAVEGLMENSMVADAVDEKRAAVAVAIAEFRKLNNMPERITHDEAEDVSK